jgi:aminopeptidase N
MEYPTLITAGTSWLIPSALTASTPEEVTIHETGHQWFYGVVGSNEFEDAWMDEGINTYASVRAMLAGGTKSYYERRFFRGFVPWVFRNLELPRETFWDRLPGYRRAPKSDLPSMPAFRYSVADGRVVTYNKSALWLNTLERMLGWPVMQRVLATYYERWQFKHPGPADFFAIVNEVSGRDLTWFLDQVYRSSNVFDYAVDELKSARDGAVFRTELIVRRNGEAIAPVDVLVTFADGSQQRETWDGQARWRRYTFDRASRAMSAQVDPDRVLLLDVNYTNNSKTLEPQSARAATKWSLAWLIWLQDALLAWAALA